MSATMKIALFQGPDDSYDVEQNLQFLDHKVYLTLILFGFLGAVFLKGFAEAINIAVAIVAFFLLVNVFVIGFGLYEIAFVRPEAITRWSDAVWAYTNVEGSIMAVVIYSVLVFPKLALGLSGFETGVVVMPLVKGGAKLKSRDIESIHLSRIGDLPMSENAEEYLNGRIRNGKKLLTSAALIMSVMLLGSSIVTSMLIPPEAFLENGEANGRALSYLAHDHLGELFGTVYDISTILILWFAGSSAMAGLLNIVPRYLPRYGMAPYWANATRPLVLVFTAISFLVTILFRADVD